MNSPNLFVASVAFGVAILVLGWISFNQGAPSEESATLASDRGAALPSLNLFAAAQPTAASEPVGKVAGDVAVAYSLQGTQEDGGWLVDKDGRLIPHVGVRHRFDYWLAAIGELDLAQISARVLGGAQRELPASAADQVRRLWSGYVDLQGHPWTMNPTPDEPANWRAALEERQLVRRSKLGREWADAFYSEEEKALWGRIHAWETTGSFKSTAAPDPTPPEHPQAVQRVAAEMDEWAAWEARVESARAEYARISGAQELSGVQREEALNAWLARHFSSQEQRRVRGLLSVR